MLRLVALSVLVCAGGCAVGAQWEHEEHQGPGTTAESPTPRIQPSCPESSPAVKQLSLSEYASYAVLEDGSLWCWGRCWPDAYEPAQLDQTTPRPVRVHLDGVVKVVAGEDSHACAILNDGTVRCWGRNFFGESGPGASLAQSIWTIETPSVIAISGVVDADSGTGHMCGLRQDGTVACWGLPWMFFPPDAPLPAEVPADGPQPVPVEIPGIEPGGLTIEGGGSVHCVRGSKGTLQCWGIMAGPDLSHEVLPIRTFAAAEQPVCFVDLQGHARCGFNPGELPVSVPAWNGAVGLAMSDAAGHACAWFPDGRARCVHTPGWGPIHAVPEHLDPVPGLTKTTHVAVEAYHGCAIDGGCVRCWGRNDEGQLGDGTYQSSDVPTFVVWE